MVKSNGMPKKSYGILIRLNNWHYLYWWPPQIIRCDQLCAVWSSRAPVLYVTQKLQTDWFPAERSVPLDFISAQSNKLKEIMQTIKCVVVGDGAVGKVCIKSYPFCMVVLCHSILCSRCAPAESTTTARPPLPSLAINQQQHHRLGSSVWTT